MKRLFILGLVFALFAASYVAANGSKESSSTSGQQPAATAAHKTSGFRIFMTPKWTTFPYFKRAMEGAKKASEELGDTFTYAGPDQPEVQLQVQTLQNFVAQKPDGIILAALDLNAVAPVLQQARSQGVIVTTFDADAAVDARDFFANQMSYEQAAKTILDTALIDDPSGGLIAFVAASPTTVNHMEHIKYMKQLIASDPKYKVFTAGPTEFAQDDDAKSYQVAINLMQAYPDLKVIVSSSAVSAPAAARAIDATNHVGKVFAAGFALPSSIKGYLQDGSEKAFALWDPYNLGYLAFYITHMALAGQLSKTPGTTFTAGSLGQFTVGQDGEVDYGRPLIFTKDNIDQYNF